MVKNYFYLIVGLLCILFSATHTLNGTTTILPSLVVAGIEKGTVTTFTYVWHIIGVENLILGITLVIMAFSRDMAKVKFTAWLIIAILALRWLTITSITLMAGDAIKQIIPDTVAMFLLIVLLTLGTRSRPKA